MDKLKVFFATFFLTIATGVIAQTTSIHDMKDTWNAGGTTFDAIKMTVTDTASAADSKLLNLNASTGGLFTVGKDGTLTMTGTQYIAEQADAAADVAGYGQVWVNTATPNELWFTDDAGTDVQLGTPHTPEGTAVKSTGELITEYLRADGDGTSSWQTIPTPAAPEGSAVLSTGELVTKFLRADGDNTSSWQVPPFIANVVEDTTPQLGGTLDLNGFDITAVAPSTDVATAARTISGQSANLAAVVNTSASPLSLKMGEHATAGGTAGLVRVLAPNDTVVQSWNEIGNITGLTFLADNTNGNYAFGSGAGDSIAVGSGTENITIGKNAGTAITTADKNIVLGTDAFKAVSSGGSGNIVMGYRAAMSGLLSSDNIVLGQNAGESASTSDSILIGQNAGDTAISGNGQIAIGSLAMGNSAVTGLRNIGIGYSASDNVTSGAYNISIGSNTEPSDITGSSQLSIGSNASAIAVPAIHGYMGANTDLDHSSKTLTITGSSALPAAVTNLDGGTLTLQGGLGASGSAGDADGGNLILKGGTAYGTGSNGIVDLQAIVQVDPYSRHLQIPANAVSLGPTAPVNVTVNTAVRCLEFDEGEEAFIQHEVPDDWVGGEDLVFEIDWIPNAAGIANGETVIWSFDLLSRVEGEDLDTGAVTTGGTTYTSSGATAQGTIVHTKLVLDYNDATNPLAKQDHFFVRFYHDATSTFNGKACVTALEYLYNSESFPQI